MRSEAKEELGKRKSRALTIRFVVYFMVKSDDI